MIDGPRCPQCGKFLKDAHAHGNELDGLTNVHGICSVHGKVESLAGWYWAWEAWQWPGEH